MESPMSTLSPSEKGNELPFAMAAETADLRKSIVVRAGRLFGGYVVGPWGGSMAGVEDREEEEV